MPLGSHIPDQHLKLTPALCPRKLQVSCFWDTVGLHSALSILFHIYKTELVGGKARCLVDEATSLTDYEMDPLSSSLRMHPPVVVRP